MSGSNGLKKFLTTNREGELNPLKYRGVEFSSLNFDSTVVSTISASQMLSNLDISNSGSPITGPTAVQVFTPLSQQYLTAVGSTWTQIIDNSASGVGRVINFGTGFTPSSITIAANTTEFIQWEVTSASPSFGVTAIYMYPSTTGSGGTVVTSFNTRTGAVVPAVGDYTASQVTNSPSGNISAISVQAAINELDIEKITDPTSSVNRDVLIWDVGSWKNSGQQHGGHMASLDLQYDGSGFGHLTPSGYVFEAQSFAGFPPPNGMSLTQMNSGFPAAPGVVDMKNLLLCNNFGTRAQVDTVHRVLLAAGATDPASGVTNGGYVYYVEKGVGTPTFWVTPSGFVKCAPRAAPTAASANIGLNVNSEIADVASRAEYKKNIEPLDHQKDAHIVDFISKLSPVKFLYKEDPQEMKQLGFIVDEIESILPKEDAQRFLSYEIKDHKYTDRAVGLNPVALISGILHYAHSLEERIKILEQK